MKLCGNGKWIEFIIEDYQYSVDVLKKLDNIDYYDKNWLMIKVTYHDEKSDDVYYDPCLLVDELKDIAKHLKKVIAGKEDCYIPMHIEPNLRLCITKVNDKIVFAVNFWAEHTKIKPVEKKVSAVLTMTEAKDILNELNDMREKFPER